MSDEGRSSQDSVVSLLAGIGVGVLIGSAVALLLAPQSGVQTRTQIRESADDAIGRLRESMDDLRTKVDEMSVQAKEAIASRRGGGQGALQADTAGSSGEGAGSPAAG